MVNLMITPFSAIMIGLVFLILRPYKEMGFDERYEFQISRLRIRRILLAGCNVFGYIGLLVILIIAFCTMSGELDGASLPFSKELVTLTISGFITIIVGIILSSVLSGEGRAVSGISITIGVITQALIVGAIGWIYYTNNPNIFHSTIMVDAIQTTYSHELANRIAYRGDAVYLGITYIILAMLLLAIAAFDKARVSKERSVQIDLLIEKCPALSKNSQS